MKQCTICHKTSAMGGHYKKLISKYNPSPKKRKYPNLQWLKVPLGIQKEKYRQFAGKRIVACTKCIKALGKA